MDYLLSREFDAGVRCERKQAPDEQNVGFVKYTSS